MTHLGQFKKGNQPPAHKSGCGCFRCSHIVTSHKVGCSCFRCTGVQAKHKPECICVKCSGVSWNKDKKLSEEHKQKIKENHKHQKSMLGKHHTIKSRILISNSQKGRIVSDKTREKIRNNTIEYVKNIRCNGNFMYPCIGKYETQILDNLEKAIFPLKIHRQYRVGGYFLDGYCKTLNLAIEIDEKHHRAITKLEKELYREEQIKKELNCTFLRIPIYDGDYSA